MQLTKPTLLLAMLLPFSTCAHPQPSASPTPTALTPLSYKLRQSFRGDLNKDGQEDVVLLVKASGKEGMETDENGQKVDRNRRGLLIAFKKGKNHAVVLQNLRCFSSENEPGGVYFPPDLNIEIRQGNLLIQYNHGRYGHWSYKFRYQNAHFRLIGYDSSSNHGPVVESSISINLLSNKVLSKVNTNLDADGGDERFKETWSTLKNPKPIYLSDIADFDEFSVVRTLGIVDAIGAHMD